MKISKVVIRRMSLDFKVPFRTSFGLNTRKDFSIVELHDSDGNVAAAPAPHSGGPGTMRKPQKGRFLLSKNSWCRHFLMPVISRIRSGSSTIHPG